MGRVAVAILGALCGVSVAVWFVGGLAWLARVTYLWPLGLLVGYLTWPLWVVAGACLGVHVSLALLDGDRHGAEAGDLGQWIQFEESAEVDRLTVHGVRVPKDGLFVGVVALLGVIALAGSLLFSIVFDVRLGGGLVGLGIGLALAFVCALGLLGTRVKTVVSIRDGGVLVEQALPGARWGVRRADLERVTFEFYTSLGSPESIATVNLFRRGGNPLRRRRRLGAGLHREPLRELFTVLVRLLDKRGYEAERRCDVPVPRGSGAVGSER